MKTFKDHIFCLLLAVLTLASCEQDNIDPITQVTPGADALSPIVTINYPLEGTKIKVLEEITSIEIDFEVTDDIEVASISIMIDGSEISNLTEFLDYKRVLNKVSYNNLNTGVHELKIIAADLEGKSTTAKVNFEKEPAYSPLYMGETLYMPFDGDLVELISISFADKVGTPGFSDEAKEGAKSLMPGTDNYVTFPTDGLLSSEFSASFWYKVNATPDRAGIIVIGDDADDRNQGFRLFREGSATEQRIKANVGIGSGDSWNDGGVINVDAGEWVHVAFTISNTENVIYLNGQLMNTGNLSSPIDWTGCNLVTIGAGGDTFSYWNHLSDSSEIDDLRFFNRSLSSADVQGIANSGYQPVLPSETLYLPFNGSVAEVNTGVNATMVGTTGYAGDSFEGGDSFMGAADSYLTFPINNLFGADQFSAVFWYKVSADPTRAGILVVGDNADDRNQGFRLFREGSGTSQQIKANIGIGSGESWNDGANIDVDAGEWVQVALTVSGTESKIYFNGVLKNTSAFANPIDFTDCTELVIGSGGPTFDYWNHLYDSSAIDALRIFNKALTEDEIKAML